MKKILSILVCLMMFVLSGCGGSGTESTEKKDEKLSLVGTWIQTNSKSEDAYQKAVITDNSIEVYWVSEGGASEALYWAGTYEEPTKNTKEYTWTSMNDTEKTSMALLASDDETKEFQYKKGVISYPVSALGVTNTVELEKEKK